MSKNIIALFAAFLLMAAQGYAQNKCATMVMYEKYKQLYPQIAQYEQQLSNEYHNALQQPNIQRISRTTNDSSDVIFDIPVVVHIIHNYGAEYIPDDSIYHMIAEMNRIYSLNYDTSATIAPFKKYVGKANIQFHLATKDPVGRPTKGITRHYSYLTFGGDDQAKFDLWAPSNYYNIWIENKIGLGAEGGGFVLAYANFPSSAGAYPYNDGVISGYQFVNPNPYGPLTVEHETGHYFNLLHPWNNNGLGEGTCGTYCGDDDVDDTPPTIGHCSTCDLADTQCANGYAKVYPSAISGIDSLVDYPDTTNVQNIMDYATCPLMFTKLQVVRMRAALNSNIGNRNNLWSNANLWRTGVKDSSSNSYISGLDLPPIVDYSVNNHFVCANTGKVSFTNRSWNDTIVATSWTFSNGSNTQNSTAIKSVNNVTFSEPGWVKVTMSVMGNNTSTTSVTDSQKVYVASATATSANGYYQEFNDASDIAKWPSFNYYNNGFKWKLVNNAGYYDNTSIEYTAFDDRIFPDNVTGTPVGDFDDLYTEPFDLTSLIGTANPVSLNYMYSGTTRTGFSQNINDTLEVAYNINCGQIWTPLVELTKTGIDNEGTLTTPYTPQGSSQWSLKSIALPSDAVTNHTIFRFRYKPGAYGNNFYMDRVNFSNDPLGLNTLLTDKGNIVVAPNPTNGSTYVIISDKVNSNVKVQVADVTGKIVYSMQGQLTSKIERIEIPRSAIPTAGIYLVRIFSGTMVNIDKLVVY